MGSTAIDVFANGNTLRSSFEWPLPVCPVCGSNDATLSIPTCRLAVDHLFLSIWTSCSYRWNALRQNSDIMWRASRITTATGAFNGGRILSSLLRDRALSTAVGHPFAERHASANHFAWPSCLAFWPICAIDRYLRRSNYPGVEHAASDLGGNARQGTRSLRIVIAYRRGPGRRPDARNDDVVGPAPFCRRDNLVVVAGAGA